LKVEPTSKVEVEYDDDSKLVKLTKAEDENNIPPLPFSVLSINETLTLRYNVDGWIKKIDLTDPDIKSLINQGVNPELDYLSKAAAHKYHKRYSVWQDQERL
jgi:hypothetical protein